MKQEYINASNSFDRRSINLRNVLEEPVGLLQEAKGRNSARNFLSPQEFREQHLKHFKSPSSPDKQIKNSSELDKAFQMILRKQKDHRHRMQHLESVKSDHNKIVKKKSVEFENKVKIQESTKEPETKKLESKGQKQISALKQANKVLANQLKVFQVRQQQKSFIDRQFRIMKLQNDRLKTEIMETKAKCEREIQMKNQKIEETNKSSGMIKVHYQNLSEIFDAQHKQLLTLKEEMERKNKLIEEIRMLKAQKLKDQQKFTKITEQLNKTIREQEQQKQKVLMELKSANNETAEIKKSNQTLHECVQRLQRQVIMICSEEKKHLEEINKLSEDNRKLSSQLDFMKEKNRKTEQKLSLASREVQDVKNQLKGKEHYINEYHQKVKKLEGMIKLMKEEIAENQQVQQTIKLASVEMMEEFMKEMESLEQSNSTLRKFIGERAKSESEEEISSILLSNPVKMTRTKSTAAFEGDQTETPISIWKRTSFDFKEARNFLLSDDGGMPGGCHSYDEFDE